MTTQRSSKTSSNCFIRAPRSKNLNLYVYSLLDQGLSPSKICEKINMNKTALSYHLKKLKASGSISKVGYGVWKTHGFDEKRSSNFAVRGSAGFIRAQQTSSNYGFIKKSAKEVRGHGFRFNVKLPFFSRWSERKEWMRKKNIDFKSVPYGESIEIRGHRVKIFSRSLDIYFSSSWSYFGNDAEGVFQYAILELNSILTSFENIFNVSLGSKRRWKISRQHYALVRNALARDYLLKKKKLNVYNEDGSLWFVIDNSYHLEEAETVHAGSAVDDNVKVQNFFNGVKNTGITPEFIMNSFNELIDDRKYYSESMREYGENMKSHIGAIKTLDNQIKRLGDIVYILASKKE